MLSINSYILVSDVLWADCLQQDDSKATSPGGYDDKALGVLYFSFLFSAILAGTKVVRVYYLKEMSEKRDSTALQQNGVRRGSGDTFCR